MTRQGASIRPDDEAAVLGGSLLGRLSGPIMVGCAAVLAPAMMSDVYPGAGAAVLVCGAIVLAWSVARAGRLAVVATSQALVVVNPFRTVRIDWDDIASVRHVQTPWTSTPRGAPQRRVFSISHSAFGTVQRCPLRVVRRVRRRRRRPWRRPRHPRGTDKPAIASGGRRFVSARGRRPSRAAAACGRADRRSTPPGCARARATRAPARSRWPGRPIHRRARARTPPGSPRS